MISPLTNGSKNSGYLAKHTVAQDRAAPITDEVVVLCPKCKTFETLCITSGRLNKTQKFRQEYGGVYHDCGSEEPCLLLRRFLKGGLTR